MTALLPPGGRCRAERDGGRLNDIRATASGSLLLPPHPRGEEL
jgi:hypothetical protein